MDGNPMPRSQGSHGHKVRRLMRETGRSGTPCPTRDGAAQQQPRGPATKIAIVTDLLGGKAREWLSTLHGHHIMVMATKTRAGTTELIVIARGQGRTHEAGTKGQSLPTTKPKLQLLLQPAGRLSAVSRSGARPSLLQHNSKLREWLTGLSADTATCMSLASKLTMLQPGHQLVKPDLSLSGIPHLSTSP